MMKIMMGPMVSEMELSIDCDYIGQPDNTKITIHWYCHIQLDPYIEQLESFKNVMKIKVYNTHHHILKTRTHANLDKVCKNGFQAKSYLEKFKEVQEDLTSNSCNVRFEVRASLPLYFSFDSPNAFQFVLNAALEVWTNSEWIHLPVPHIQRSMIRVFEFVTSKHVPPQFRCFDIRNHTKLGKQAKDFLTMTFVNLGFASARSNEIFMETFDPHWKEGQPLPLEWYMYYVWLHQFELWDPEGESWSLFLDDEYISSPMISALHKRGERKMNGLFWPEWYERTRNGNDLIEFHLFHQSQPLVLSTNNMDSSFGNVEEFLERTRAGMAMSREEGGYGDDGSDDIPNDPHGPGYHGSYDGIIGQILGSVRMDRRKDGQYVARFKSGGNAAVAISKLAVAQRIVSRMDPNEQTNDNVDAYVDWRNTLRLKEIEKSHDEHSLVNSHSNTLSEKEEIIENVKFTPEKKRKRNRNKKIYRATYVGTGGRAASGTQSEIADSLIERNVDWRNEIMLR